MADKSRCLDLIQYMDRLWFNQNIMKKMAITKGESTKSEEKSIRSGLSLTPSPPTYQSKEKEEQLPTQCKVVVNKNEFQLQRVATSMHVCLSPARESKPRRLSTMRACKSFSELELEELKGFMDLGFKFNKEQLSPLVKSVLPGLQMVKEKRAVTRPYLSEAWLIKRPDSPLLNLRVPPISATSRADVQKHLRSWARTVAYEIHQES